MADAESDTKQRGPAVPPPVPEDAVEQSKLAAAAMRLRDEQLRARVLYVDPTMETNAELDAITERVVAELRKLQHAGLARKADDDYGMSEIELMRTLRVLLEKMLSARREHFMRHKLELIQRRIAQLFFTSEVRENPLISKSSTFRHPDEALLFVLRRYIAGLQRDLNSLKYESEEVKVAAEERLARVEKELVGSVLARTRPELERLLAVFRDVLIVFLLKDFRDDLGDFSWEVVKISKSARAGVGYKVSQQRFPAFRQAFERRFLERLLAGVSEPLRERLRKGNFRSETIRFASDPRIYAQICGILSNTMYDYLHGEGLLDLPVSWQRRVIND